MARASLLTFSRRAAICAIILLMAACATRIEYRDAPPSGKVAQATSDGGSVEPTADADAPLDASGTNPDANPYHCQAPANRCGRGGAVDVLNEELPVAPCLCGNEMGYEGCGIGANGNADEDGGVSVIDKCTDWCKANNPGFEAFTTCNIEATAYGFTFHCECSQP